MDLEVSLHAIEMSTTYNLQVYVNLKDKSQSVEAKYQECISTCTYHLIYFLSTRNIDESTPYYQNIKMNVMQQ